MENIIDKEYEINEGVFVLHNTLEALYEKYKYTLPKKIRNQLKIIVDATDELIGEDHKLARTYDITKEELILKLEYEKFIANATKKGSR